MTYSIGDPNHIGVHNDLALDVAQQAATFGVEVTLPPQRNLGDRQHVDDHNLIAAAIQAIADYSGPLPSTTTVFGLTSTQDFVVPANATQVNVYAVGGGSGGSYPTHGGGGRINEVTDYSVTGGSTLVVTVGAGGPAGSAGGTSSVSGPNGNIATAPGGSVGGSPGAGGIGQWHDVWGWKAAGGCANESSRGVPQGGGGSGNSGCSTGGQSAADHTGSGGGGSGGGSGAGAGGSGFVGLIFR